MSSIDRSYNEKRDFIRMQINSAVTVRHDGNEYQGICKDLSGAGMLLELESPLAVGDELEVLIPQEGDNHMPFHASATVSRVEAGENDSTILGLSIKEILD